VRLHFAPAITLFTHPKTLKVKYRLGSWILDHQFQCRARQKRGISHGDDDNGEEEAMLLDDLFREDMR